MARRAQTASKNKETTRKTAVKKTTTKAKKPRRPNVLKRAYRSLKQKKSNAPHKSFKLTRKRDKPPVPPLENIISFTLHVFKMLWRNKGLFFRLLILYVVAAIIWIGVLQNENMSTVNDATEAAQEVVGTAGDGLIQSVTVVATTILGSLNANMTEVQYIYLSILYIILILVTVWLLRQRLAGNKVKLRDGLYVAPAPIVPMYVLVVVGILQLLPFGLMFLLHGSAVASGIVTGGIEKAMFDIALFVVGVLTLYFITTTVFALMVATLPGTYPTKAYRVAKSIVLGQRLRMLFRLVWMVLIVVIVWFIVLVPVVMLANAYSIQDGPLIPIFVQILTGFSVIYGSAYNYLLYRRMIDDPVVPR